LEKEQIREEKDSEKRSKIGKERDGDKEREREKR
jgi:hypothetical protein